MKTSSAELFDGHLHLATKVARKMMRFKRIGMEYEDVHQEALIGLDKASKTFYENNDSNVTFERFAVPIIYTTALRFVMYKQNHLHTSKHIIDIAVTINKRKMIEQTPQDIAKELNAKQHYVELALQHLNQQFPVSVYQPIRGMGDEATGLSLIDTFTDKTDFYDASLLDIKMFIDALESEKKKIIELRMAGLSQLEIAKIIGRSQNYISRKIRVIKDQYIEYMQIS